MRWLFMASQEAFSLLISPFRQAEVVHHHVDKEKEWHAPQNQRDKKPQEQCPAPFVSKHTFGAHKDCRLALTCSLALQRYLFRPRSRDFLLAFFRVQFRGSEDTLLHTKVIQEGLYKFLIYSAAGVRWSQEAFLRNHFREQCCR